MHVSIVCICAFVYVSSGLFALDIDVTVSLYREDHVVVAVPAAEHVVRRWLIFACI